MFVKLSKVFLLLFWLLFGISFFRAFPEPYQAIVYWTGVLLLLVHVLEYAMYRKKIAANNAGGFNGFVQTMLFGLFYWWPKIKK